MRSAIEPCRQPTHHVEGLSSARWTERIQALAAVARNGPASERSDARAELWVLINGAVLRYVNAELPRLGPIGREDVRDIVTGKALDLWTRLLDGRWDPCRAEPSQVRAMLAATARHGAIDFLRAHGPRRRFAPPLADWEERLVAPSGHQPEMALERRRFAEALRSCLFRLTPRARRIWYLRVLLELPSANVARHPDVRASRAAVDMALARARRSIRTCMLRKGFCNHPSLEGVFSTIYRLFAGEESRGGKGAR